MANEFVARKGLIVSGSTTITGSVSIGGTVTASLFKGDGSQLTNIAASLAIDNYQFIGDGIISEYILSESYTPNSVLVSVEGINYSYGNDFTLSGPTMSFVVAPPSESNISVNAFLAVSSGSYINYTGSFIGDGYGLDNLRTSLAVEQYVFVGDGVADTYVVSSSYAPQSMLVTVGGLRYVNDNDYTVTGPNIQFVQAPPSNSIIVVQAFLTVSSGSIGTFSGSFLGTASYADTAGIASNVLKTKAGAITNAAFGGTPLSASVTFNTAFTDTNYSIAITGEDPRAWTIQNKTASGFVVNSVSNTALTGTTYWTCTAYGEN